MLGPYLDIPISDISTIFEAPGTLLTTNIRRNGIEQVYDSVDGKQLEENKGNILYLAGSDATASEKALLLAMAMLVCHSPAPRGMLCRCHVEHHHVAHASDSFDLPCVAVLPVT